MADKTKSVSFLFIVLILALLSSTGGVFYLLQKERAKSLSLQDELSDVQINQKATETKLQESQKLISVLESKLGAAKGQIDTLTSDLQQEKIIKQEALAKIEQLKIELEDKDRLRSELENKFNEVQKDTEKLQIKLKELENKKEVLETKIKELETTQSQGVELGKIVVSPEATITPDIAIKPADEELQKKISPMSGLEGKVLVINKDYDFAIINLGTKHGVEIGNIFSIYHNNKYVGDIRIERISDSMSAADFVSGDIKGKFSEGDKVVQKAK